MNKEQQHPFDEAEWAAQERAMHDARNSKTPATADPVEASYRRIATALMDAPQTEPPTDFAATVARQADRPDSAGERRLLAILVLVFAVSAALVSAAHAGTWWLLMREALAGADPQWLLAGFGCMALSWLLRQLHQSRDPFGPASP